MLVLVCVVIIPIWPPFLSSLFSPHIFSRPPPCGQPISRKVQDFPPPSFSVTPDEQSTLFLVWRRESTFSLNLFKNTDWSVYKATVEASPLSAENVSFRLGVEKPLSHRSSFCLSRVKWQEKREERRDFCSSSMGNFVLSLASTFSFLLPPLSHVTEKRPRKYCSFLVTLSLLSPNRYCLNKCKHVRKQLLFFGGAEQKNGCHCRKKVFFLPLDLRGDFHSKVLA